ncbi:MAG: hypothetical protein HYU59_09055 [Magnetospirillum gryphiswaldense]|nr:hypothetical protein [Magnetospirillum gryphiswaldense]
MPDTVNPQRQAWITLPQALRWVMAGEMPTLENRETLPSCPSEHTSRANLFSFWIDGRLKLYGLEGYYPNRPWTPLQSSLTYEYDCWEGTDLVWIRPQVIKQANFDSIDWEHGTLGRFHLLKDEVDSHPYFIDLRVRWNDLYAITTGKEAPAYEKKSHGGLVVETPKRRGGRKPRKDWPLLAALSIMVGDRNPNFWAVSTDDKLGILRPILEAGHHVSPNNNTLPGRSQFDKIALPYMKVANELLAERRSLGLPLMQDMLPFVAALVAIIREHDREPGEVSCESKMTEQVKYLLSATADLEGSNFLGSSDIGLYKKAQAVTKYANEAHKEFCCKPHLRPI